MLFFLELISIILAPLYIIRFKFFEIPSTLLEILLLLTIGIFFIQFVKDGLPFKKLRTYLDIPLAVLLTGAIIGVFVTPDTLGGLGILKAYFIEPILFYYSLIFTFRTTPKDNIQKNYYLLLTSFLISGSWLIILSIIQKVTHQYSFAPYELIQGRVPAVFNSANSLALYLGPVLFFGIILFLIQKKWRWLLLIYSVVSIIILIWTRSRGGIVAEFISLIIFGYFCYGLKFKSVLKVWWLVPTTIIISAIVFLSTYFSTHPLTEQTYTNPHEETDTLKIRLLIWNGTYNLLHDHPIVGAGLNGFKPVYGEQYRINQFQEQVQYPHNIILTFWTETGIIGLLGFILIAVTFFRQIGLRIEKNRNPVIGLGLIAGMSFILIHGIVDVPYFKNDLSLEFMSILALSVIWVTEFID